jgi:hypothetical protein
MADATALLRTYTSLFAHYRTPHVRNGRLSTPSSHSGSGKKAGRTAAGSGGSSRAGKGDLGFALGNGHSEGQPGAR